MFYLAIIIIMFGCLVRLFGAAARRPRANAAETPANPAYLRNLRLLSISAVLNSVLDAAAMRASPYDTAGVCWGQ